MKKEAAMRKRYETRKRARVAMEVITSSWDDALEFETSDMSPQGAFVQSEILPTVGEHIVCVFTLEGTKREFALFGEVLAPRAGIVAVDVGSTCVAGVIDHHFAEAGEDCAVSLVPCLESVADLVSLTGVEILPDRGVSRPARVV